MLGGEAASEKGGTYTMRLFWILVRWGLNTVALIVVAWLLSGIQVTWGAAIIAALVIGVLNAVVGPILKILTFPITIVTLGLFLLVINAFLFWIASAVVPGFSVNGFWAVVIGSILYSILTTLIARFVEGREKAANR
jgi:putative membrane protein